MILFKCKMCGGNIEFESGATVGVCDSCGTKQTLPRLDDDRRANLYDRANHFRRNNEFDKAAGIYEQILNEDNTDAEAYWSILLCRFGIEYVEDPVTHKRVPTVNRTQYTSIFDDDNYKSALNYADALQRSIYEAEATAINEIQKGILAISQKEEPFDIFICYKESDNNGRRTMDSVLANDMYHQLTQEGYKVFFSRITLEDKLGIAYEPYIFAAINSAKVMIVLGTKQEYFNAVWVKNEWSRYLSLVNQSGGKKVLIPAYRDMDPYDLPEEFSHLQAQDMGKLGFMQDLIRGIKKIISSDEVKVVVNQVQAPEENVNIAPLLKRAFIFLEDGEWKEADDYCERVLDQDPENAQAYLGKLLADLKVRRKEDLRDCKHPIDTYNNYQKVFRFGNDDLKSEIAEYNTYIKDRNEKERLARLYEEASSTMKSAKSESDYKAAATRFKTIQDYKDANILVDKCLEKAEESRKLGIYNSASNQMFGNSIENYEKAIEGFQTIYGWKDVDKKINECRLKITEIKTKEEEERLERERKAEQERVKAEKSRRLRRKINIVSIIAVVGCGAIALFVIFVLIPKIKFNYAMNLISKGEYEEAYEILAVLNKNDIILENKYDRAKSLIINEEYEQAYEILTELGEFDLVSENKYGRAKTMIENEDYEQAYVLLDQLDFEDSEELLEDIKKAYVQKVKNANIGDTVILGSYEQDNDINNGPETIEWIVLSKDEDRALLISRYALDCKEFHEVDEKNYYWGNSTLRAWLNTTFYENAFSFLDQSLISDIHTSGNKYSDKIFILSTSEAKKYFSSDEDRICYATEYCSSNGAYTYYDGSCCWWLRSEGMEYNNTWITRIRYTGSIDYRGKHFLNKQTAVRPAMWISLN